MKKKVIKHLKGDIKGYKKEIAEDEELIKDLNGKKMAKKKLKKKKMSKEEKHERKESKREKKFEKVMREFKGGKLHSGSKKGPKVTNPKQAIAIAYSEAKKSKIKKKK